MSDAPGLVIFSNRSWITEKGRYNALTETFSSFTNEKINEDYINEINKLLNDRFTFSTLILEKDYYSKLLLE